MDLRKRGQAQINPDLLYEDQGSEEKPSQIPRNNKHPKYVFFTLIGLILGISGTWMYPKALESVLGGFWQPRMYAVIIDSGSTGSRLLAFTFRKSIFHQQLLLEEELWEEVKPGLSSYAEDPKSAANSISQLILAAKRHIPQELWHQTPITLKATAGLRLLPALQAERIIEEVEQVLLYSGFKLEKTLVEIMNPRDEGLFGWFTVNFLLDNFSENLKESFVSLDLGGGSTQITFATGNAEVKGLEGRKHFLHNVTILGDKREVYSHSYLGLGLMAARQSIFTHGLDPSVNDISSPCMASSTPQTWSFHGHTYSITSAKGLTSFENCQKVVQKIVVQNNVHKPEEIHNRKIAAFSYFYDRALDTGIISQEETEHHAQIQAFIDKATIACREGSNDDSSPFLCIDLTYIVSLLVDGYGLPIDKELLLLKRINGHEASWALGVAYSIVEER